MKISKVDHRKTAVGWHIDAQGGIKKVGGFIYQHPQAKKGSDDLAERVEKLKNNGQGLYQIFSPVTIGKEPKAPSPNATKEEFDNYRVKHDNYERVKVAKEIVPLANKLLRKILFKRVEKKQVIRAEEDILSQISSSTFTEILNKSKKTKEICIEILLHYLRKSLASEKDSLRVLLLCIGAKTIETENKEIIREFIRKVNYDYDKPFIESIKKSIENQNMPVQPTKARKLVLSKSIDKADAPSVSNGKKNSENSYNRGMQKFLNAYAVIDEETRIDLLRRLRRLLDLYFSAPFIDPKEVSQVDSSIPSTVDKSLFNVWEMHEKGKTDDKDFVNIPQVLVDKENGKSLKTEERDKAKTELNAAIETRNCCCFRYANRVFRGCKEDLFFSDDDINFFWISYFEDAVERILLGKRPPQNCKLKIGKLREKIWKNALNYISMKFVAIGKAVYQFVISENLRKMSKEEDVDFTAVKDEVTAISSFEYERIKAMETLQRDTSVEIAFAINNLANAVMDLKPGNEDFLLINDLDKYRKKPISSDDQKKETLDQEKETLRLILQFFGGISQWDKRMFSDSYGESQYGLAFLKDIKTMLYSLRNESFHFSTIVKGEEWNTELVKELIKHDTERYGKQLKNSFYSNNLAVFYCQEDLEKVLNQLYSSYHDRNAQIPAYENVIARKNFPEFLNNLIPKGTYPPFDSIEDEFKWQSALYYLFKEVYYNLFLPDPGIKDEFIGIVKSCKSNGTDQECWANKDFENRIGEIKGKTFPEICQIIMTDYNMQNQGQRKVAITGSKEEESVIFKHYRMLLYKHLQNTFATYLQSAMSPRNILFFLKSPGKQELSAIEGFLSDWKTDMFSDLFNTDNKNLQRWYMAGKFLNSRSLNRLLGCFRSYIQYVKEIETRVGATGGSCCVETSPKPDELKDVIKVLILCSRLSSVFSQNVDDYFGSAEEYAEYLSKYVSFRGNDNSNLLGQLQAFCAERGGLYMDEKNPVLNRNLVMSKLYAPAAVLQNIGPIVTEEMLVNYKEAISKIKMYKVKGKCQTKKDQEELVKFQQLKNAVELRDLSEYGEIIMELLGQLVNWSYLRERDLLYYQLGFHYTCLNNDSEKPPAYVEIRNSNRTVTGAILYQITAMYIYGLKIMGTDGTFSDDTHNSSTSNSIKEFLTYSRQITGKTEVLYNAGLEVFETISEHDSIIAVRNAIDHFKYYSGTAGSILDLYSEVFDRFFTYDMKFAKNVPNMLANILARHHIVFTPNFETGSKVVKEKKKNQDEQFKARAQIKIKKLYSDKFTYILGNGEKVVLDARSSEFTDTVEKLLSFG